MHIYTCAHACTLCSVQICVNKKKSSVEIINHEIANHEPSLVSKIR